MRQFFFCYVSSIVSSLERAASAGSMVNLGGTAMVLVTVWEMSLSREWTLVEKSKRAMREYQKKVHIFLSLY